MSLIKIPFLNPIKYYELNPVEVPQYVSRHLERYRFSTTIKEWHQQTDYGQLFQTTDHIWQQLTSEVGPVQIELLNEGLRVIYTDSFGQVLQNANAPGQRVYEHDLDLSGLGLSCGLYFLRLTFGNSSPTIFLSEPICICSLIENSLLLEYKHRAFKGDVFFETGYFPSIRVLGSLNYKSPASKDTLYEDQELNETLLNSYEFDVWELIIGGSFGIPPYLIRRLNRVFGCSFKSIDGIQYEKNDGAKWEQKEFDNYSLRGLSIELRETLSRGSLTYENNALQQKPYTIVAALDTKGFNNQSSGSEYRILDIQ